EMRREQFGSLVGRAACPGPARMVHVVRLMRAKRVQTAKVLERVDMLFDRGGNAVLRQEFTDRPALTLRRRTIVAPNVENQRVVAIAELVDLVDDPANLNIDMLCETRRHFHQTALE